MVYTKALAFYFFERELGIPAVGCMHSHNQLG